MTTRSTFSTNSRAKERMTDGDVYVFLLQVAYLSYLVQPKPEQAKSISGSASPTPLQPKKASESKSDGWLGLGGLADMIRDVGGSSSKAVRFPEKLIKRLSDRLELIAMGRDPAFKDQALRQTVGVFYGTFKEASFQKQLKENRKIEELILIFVTTAQGTLKKRLPGDEWKEELNNQVGQFVKIIRECLKTVHGVPRELTERLDGYSAKLVPAPISLSKQSSNGSASNANSSTTALETRRDSATSQNSARPPNPVAESALIKTVGELFKVPEDQLQKDVDFMRKTCTEQAAMNDLKACVKNINLQASYPGRRDDFETESGYQQWRTTELSTISQIMMGMCKNNPELLKSTPTESAASGRRAGEGSRPFSVALTAEGGAIGENGFTPADPEALSQAVDAEEEETFGSFVYIPPDPKAYYRRALELCIDYDLEQIKYQPEEEEVSLSILSRKHIDLLNECALRWRLMGPFRVLVNLDVIKYKYDRGEVPLDCISEALSTTQKAVDDGEFEAWVVDDRKLLVSIYTSLFDSFLRFLYESFQDMHNVDPEDIQPYVQMLQDIHQSNLVQFKKDVNGSQLNLEKHLEELQDGIRIMAIHEYTAKTTELFSQVVDNEIVPLVQLLEWLEKGAKRIDKRFPEPILGVIDPVSLVLEKQVPLYLDDLDSMHHQILEHASRERDPLAFEDVFALYKRVGALLKMHEAFCPNNELSFSISAWFEPHIRQWLINSDKKTTEWVNNAIASDSFTPIDSEGAVHSSSIDDLFGALQQPVEFIQSLRWPDAYRNARFLTSLAKTISRSIEQYCSRVEEMFMEEMFPRTAEGQDLMQKQSAWMVKAKQTIQGDKRVEPFHFQPASCVKLNNIEAARLLLDKLYTKIEADEQARIVKEQAPEVPNKHQRDRFIFTIKIVLGENLQPIKETSATARIDSFVTLSDERGNKIAKTRTIYETAEPRWDEVFDVPVEQSMWLAATVWDRKLVGDHSLCGRAYLRLDPRYFGDFLSHELWLDLDTQGRLLMRVSMEGEKDDILFHFGRAFRSLKRAESDMVRIIVDKMSIFIRQCLSRTVLKSLVRTSGINLDKALGNVKALYASALASTVTNTAAIPPVEAEKKKLRPAQLTDQEIEAAILPLFDYLDECLSTLKSSLSESEALLVMTKVWKEVLNTIEGILVPPLSDAPSDLTPLSDKEVDIVFKWLSFLKSYFNNYDEESGVTHGVPLEMLQNNKYREIISYSLFHDMSTDALMEEAVRAMQQNLRKAPTQRSKNKSVYQQRNLGTIKQRKKEKKEEEQPSNHDLLMKILRMRPGTSEFLTQQMAAMNHLQQQIASAGRPRGGQRVSRGGQPPLPPMPRDQRDSRRY